MAEFLEEASGLESTTIGIYRTSATVKGGRRFAFGALVVVGDRAGNVGLGYAKAPGVPAAIEKAQKYAKKAMFRVNLQEGTLPHVVYSNFSASGVRLLPASPGTGVIAGGTVRAILEMAGVRDCLSKAYGSTNQRNLARACVDGLKRLTTKAKIEELRGVKLGTSRVEEVLEAGRRFMPAGATVTRPKPPQRRDRDDRGGRGKGKGGGGRGPGRGRRDDQQQQGGQAAGGAEGAAPQA